MDHDRRHDSDRAAHATGIASARGPGKQSLTEALPIQRKAHAGAGEATADAGASLERAQGDTGHAPAGGVREKVERATGADLSDVRVHTGAASAEAASAVGARAYTSGRDVHFGAGEYNPGTADGDRLLAHELAHTVQQRGGRGAVQLKALTGSDDASERNADDVAAAALAGRTGVSVVEAPAGTIAREAAPSVTPRPPVDNAGQATTTHADPTLQDAINAPAAAPAAGVESRAANVKVVAAQANPLTTTPDICPRSDLIYQESTAQTSPAPEGFTTVSGFNGTTAAPQVEQVMTDSLYIDGRPSPNDVQQGGIGDCYFMATLMSVSQRDPGKIQSMMTPDGHGGATVRFWRRTMSNPNWLQRAFGAKPEPQYSQVSIHVSEQLQYWLQTPLGAGQRIANGQGGFFLKGAKLRSATRPRRNKWWGAIQGDQLEVHRRDEYDTAMWAPLMEKALAAFAERYGQYGGSQGEAPATGSGYAEIDGGWSHQEMFVFYGADADMAGPNGGNVQQQATTWAPGSQVLAQNPRVVDQLLLLQGRGDQAGGPNAPIVTATSMVHLLIPRLQAAIPVAQGDADWANLSVAEKTNIALISVAIATYNALPADTVKNGPKSQARAAIGTACSTAITVGNAPNLLNTAARSVPIQQMVELILDLKNIGTDNSPGQRNIYGDHVYSVVAVNFTTTTGQPVPLETLSPGMRPPFFPLVDTNVSQVTLRNPHHANTPDPTGSGASPDGPTQGVASTGIFHMSLNRFFMNFTSVESGVFPRS